MAKKAQDFLIDSTLGEKAFEIKKDDPNKIVLSIEEGAVPAGLLKDAKSRMKRGKEESLFVKLDKAVQSIGRPKAKDMATFYRVFSVLINAGIPLIKSLDTITEQTVNYKLRTTVFEVARAIEKGGKLSGSMANYPDIFPEAHIGMIRSGEASGQLNMVLKQLAIEVEKSAAIMRKVKSAMMYPAFIVIVMVVVLALMMIMVVPKIAEIFSSSGQSLPMLTQVVIGISNFMRFHWAWIFGGLIGLIAAFTGVRRTPQGKYSTDWLFLHLPVFGDLVRKSILARFSRSLGNLLASGIPIIQGLLINAKGLGNDIYRQRVELASEDVARGIPLGESLRDSPYFPAMLVQMIAIGEQTAQLDNIAVKIAEYYEDEVDSMVAGISKVIEPIILVIVAVAVGAIVGAIMLPITQLTQVTGVL